MRNFLTKFIMIVSFIGILFTIWLISSEIKSPGFCPKIFFIPACYIVFIAFFLIYASSYVINNKINNTLFFMGDFLGLLLAVWFSINQGYGFEECPKFIGIPLCYASLFVFLFLLILQLNRIVIVVRKR